MNFAGIIAEYDPFHNGHAAQIAAVRAAGAKTVAVCLSAGAVQRGGLPILPEGPRVAAALAAGADLVVALPAPYACATAEAFAAAGVHLLAALGCDTLAFGAETPDAAALVNAARLLQSPALGALLKQNLATGQTYAAARAAAAEALCPGMAALLQSPNNILGVEYCKAILAQNAPLQPCPLPRWGAGHGGAGEWLPATPTPEPQNGAFPQNTPAPPVGADAHIGPPACGPLVGADAHIGSPACGAVVGADAHIGPPACGAVVGAGARHRPATVPGQPFAGSQPALQTSGPMWASAPTEAEEPSAVSITNATTLRGLPVGDWQPYVPAAAYPLYQQAAAQGLLLDPAKFETAALALLRTADPARFAAVRGVSEGLENRLAAALRTAATLGELYAALKTKRYPHARLRRLVLDAALGVPQNLPPPPFLLVLGARKTALPRLKTAALPAGTSLADLMKTTPQAAQIGELHSKMVDFSALCRAKTQPMGLAFTTKPMVI